MVDPVPIDPEPIDPDAEPATLAAPFRADLLALVAIGGLVGTQLRYLLARAEPRTPGQFPIATFTVNIIGAFVLGMVLELLATRGPETTRRRQLRLLVGTGFCGGFTTYSTFAVDGDLLVRHGSPGLAIGYLTATVLFGLALCLAGVAVAGAGRHRPVEGR